MIGAVTNDSSTTRALRWSCPAADGRRVRSPVSLPITTTEPG
ncbi:MAG TPA: hypothetical protein VGD67_08905 [Pseudonocardiaceae bacterium]